MRGVVVNMIFGQRKKLFQEITEFYQGIPQKLSFLNKKKRILEKHSCHELKIIVFIDTRYRIRHFFVLYTVPLAVTNGKTLKFAIIIIITSIDRYYSFKLILEAKFITY